MKQTACNDRDFFTQQRPGTGFEEARAILLGMYHEQELDAEKAKEVKQHLDHCVCCTQFLGDLEKIGEFKTAQVVLPFAQCPSSATIDTYLFDRVLLPADEAKRVRKHLKECPLCKEESSWLKSVEEGRGLEFSALRVRNYMQYFAVAAAIFFFALSAFLWQQRKTSPVPDEELRALAKLERPERLDFANLEKTSVELSPETLEIYDEAIRRFQNRKFQEASLQFEDVLRLKPDHSASLFLLGYCYYEIGQPEKAFELCDRAEAIQPHSLTRCMSLVHIALMTGHFGRAVREINGLYHEAPDVPEIREMYQQITALTRGSTLQM